LERAERPVLMMTTTTMMMAPPCASKRTTKTNAFHHQLTERFLQNFRVLFDALALNGAVLFKARSDGTVYTYFERISRLWIEECTSCAVQYCTLYEFEFSSFERRTTAIIIMAAALQIGSYDDGRSSRPTPGERAKAERRYYVAS